MAPRLDAVMKDRVEVVPKLVVEIVVAEMVVGIVAEHGHGDLPSRLRRAHPMWIGCAERQGWAEQVVVQEERVAMCVQQLGSEAKPFLLHPSSKQP